MSATASSQKWTVTPTKFDTVIAIKALPTEVIRDTLNTDKSASIKGICKVSISCPKICYEETASFTNPFDPTTAEEIRWFIEDFWRLDILNRPRALTARTSLRSTCEKLIKAIKLDTVLEKLARDLHSLTTTIYIEVHGNLSTIHSVHKIPWEILEHASLWPIESVFSSPAAKPLTIELCIRRKGNAEKRTALISSAKYDFEVSFSMSVGSVRDAYPVFNILIVSARDLRNGNDADAYD